MGNLSRASGRIARVVNLASMSTEFSLRSGTREEVTYTKEGQGSQREGRRSTQEALERAQKLFKNMVSPRGGGAGGPFAQGGGGTRAKKS